MASVDDSWGGHHEGPLSTSTPAWGNTPAPGNHNGWNTIGSNSGTIGVSSFDHAPASARNIGFPRLAPTNPIGEQGTGMQSIGDERLDTAHTDTGTVVNKDVARTNEG